MIYYRAIYRRERLLGQLMDTNFERYVWVKKMLGIEWDPTTKNGDRVSTSWGLFKMEVKKDARLKREEKLEKTKKLFAEDKEDFYPEKERCIAEIEMELKKLNLKGLRA